MSLLLIAVVILTVFVCEDRLYKKRGLSDVTYTCSFSADEVSENEEFIMTEEIENRGFLPLPWIKAEITTPVYLEFADMPQSEANDLRFVSSFFTLPPHRKITRSRVVRCSRRGIHSISSVTVVGSDLFGTMNFSLPLSKENFGRPVTVFPSPVYYNSLSCEISSDGEKTSPQRLVTNPFYINGLREYQPTDPFRLIDWKSTAHTGRLMSRCEEYTTDRELLIFLDTTLYDNSTTQRYTTEDTERAIRICAGISMFCSEKNIPFRFGANCRSVLSDDISVLSQLGNGKDHSHSIMCLLSSLDISETTVHTADYLRMLSNNIDRNRTDIIIVSVFKENRGITDIDGSRIRNITVR